MLKGFFHSSEANKLNRFLTINLGIQLPLYQINLRIHVFNQKEHIEKWALVVKWTLKLEFAFE